MEAIEQEAPGRVLKMKPRARNGIAPRLESAGPGALSDAELVRGILGARVDAEALISEHGGLKALLVSEDAPPQLRLALELGRRGLMAQESRPRLRTPREIYEYLTPTLGALRHEVFHVLCFNARNALLRDVRVATGTVTACTVDPREVFRTALRAECSAIVLAHNHPSGDPEPSAADMSLTQQIIQGGQTLGIKVLDHIVVGDGRYASFLERGEMSLLSR